MRIVKDTLGNVFISLHSNLTKNLKYNRLTRKIFKKENKKDYNCIDAGGHKDEILDRLMKYSKVKILCF